MNNLIKIEVNENQEQLVSGRDLHEFLEVESNYTTWFGRMCEYGFIKDTDYGEFWSDSKNGNAVEYLGSPQKMSAMGYIIQHAIKLDMAKEIAMIQRSERGKQARQYFIEVEKQFKQQALDTQALSPQLQLLINIELEQKQIKQDIADTKQDIQGIRDVVALNSTNWREDTSRLIATMARKLGNISHIQDLRRESYEILEQRMACRLGIRLTNKKKTQAENGVCKSKRDKLNNLDIIADDKKLTEGYVAIVKEMAIKYGVVAS
ncbi:antA/AntB antirepressor family protein [Metaclostridioides mangenotii]|uniref:antA/AntB antirepressor family protein n=1 Tax=Metaclostridioides mangenotii TaxID=1540 RepID=UPI0028EB84FE|nr:antA/AntB antirepressor family protein [Clostridioides mangenotii]